MARDIRNRRRRLVINKPLQGRIVFGITLVPILTLVGATLAVAILTGRVLDEARSAEENLPTLGPLFISLFLFIVAAGAVVVIQALKYSHRIAGPMYRLVQSLKRIRERDLSFRVKLRTGDELQDVAEELNRVMDWLQDHPLRDGEWMLDPPEDEAQKPGDGSGPTAKDQEEPQPVVEKQAVGASTSE